jgi:hypothetical protein
MQSCRSRWYRCRARIDGLLSSISLPLLVGTYRISPSFMATSGALPLINQTFTGIVIASFLPSSRVRTSCTRFNADACPPPPASAITSSTVKRAGHRARKLRVWPHCPDIHNARLRNQNRIARENLDVRDDRLECLRVVFHCDGIPGIVLVRNDDMRCASCVMPPAAAIRSFSL